MQALLIGKLVRDGDCLVVEGKDGRHVALPIWPHGFSYDHENGRIAVVDESGDVVFRSGERVSMAGGLIGEPESPLPANLKNRVGGCEGPYWIVGDV